MKIIAVTICTAVVVGLVVVVAIRRHRARLRMIARISKIHVNFGCG